MATKGKNLKTEIESLLIAAQNNTKRTNHIKAKLMIRSRTANADYMKKNDETMNHIITKCSKLAQKKYKTRHEWVGKVIHLELCKMFKFDYTIKWYMHKPESVQEVET